MARFGRTTILAVGGFLDTRSHADLSRWILEVGLEGTSADAGGPLSGKKRVNAILEFLLRNPDATNAEGANFVDAIVEDVVERTLSSTYSRSSADFQEASPRLARALQRDGFVIVDGQLRHALPQSLALPQADDEVHALLKQFGLTIPLGHLDQAIDAHSRGNWAAANGQLRTFMEGLLDEIAARLVPAGGSLPGPGHGRRAWLAALTPPFLLPDLNEWEGQGKGFLEGFFRRLHPQGSHPGLSDEEDSTFRLHVVLLVSRLLLRRLARSPQG